MFSHVKLLFFITESGFEESDVIALVPSQKTLSDKRYSSENILDIRNTSSVSYF